MLETIRNAFKVKEIRQKLFFTFLMLIVVRLGCQIPVPGTDAKVLANLMRKFSSSDAYSFFSAFTGGSLEKMSIFALSITPYITSSIIMQLLTIAIPKLEEIQKQLKEKTGKTIEVMVYGDGAFKDPVGKIWELADPVVSPGFTDGLIGLPSELKLKYLADNQFAGMKGEELRDAMTQYIANKKKDLMGSMESQGTTPRQLTDLIGSLCDLTSGSGDKGTPVIFIQGYFDNYSNE
mgnify:CR=1 FL=1